MPPILLLSVSLLVTLGNAAHAALPTPQIAPHPAAGVLLVAKPDMPDPRFQHSVILLLSHDQDGTVGVIINRPTRFTLKQALPDMPSSNATLYLGGPVELQRILLLARGQPPAGDTHTVAGDIYWSTDAKVLKALLGKSSAAQQLRVFAGYAGWAAGQLQREIRRGSWRLFEATPDVIFSDDPNSLWDHFNQAPEQIMAGTTARSTSSCESLFS